MQPIEKNRSRTGDKHRQKHRQKGENAALQPLFLRAVFTAPEFLIQPYDQPADEPHRMGQLRRVADDQIQHQPGEKTYHNDLRHNITLGFSDFLL